MPRPQNNRERRGDKNDKNEKFQSFQRPKLKITRTAKAGKVYVDYKDTESLKKFVSGNGKILSRRRTGATAMEQRMIASAVKRARYMGLMPYVTTMG
ncbi:MAG TPA: 30S ribosomal protein S18 [Tepidisphaeraceae bacterium]|jgi:small subunit ribosomal protein S18